MANLKWKDAIYKVLEEEKKALHYTEIAELIAKRGYRTSLGATPQDTVSSNLTTDIKLNKENSRFAKVGIGMYILREIVDQESALKIAEPVSIEALERCRIVNSFGIYWNRDLVHWKTAPDLLGIQQIGANPVNFKEQVGIYLLHDDRETIYVGQAIEQHLGVRLKYHISDRLGGRWNRFSWFGFHGVSDTGALHKNTNFNNLTIQDLGHLLEAILIESIEPRQNRKQGNLFAGIEYLQQEAPEIQKKKKEELIKELIANI
jgi:hypothetical protein